MTQLASSLRHKNHWILTLACLGAVACNNAPNDADHESMGGAQATGGATQKGSTPVAAGGSTTTTKSLGTGTGGHGYTTTNPLPSGGAPAEGGSTSGVGGTSNSNTTAATGGMVNSAGTGSTNEVGGSSASAGSSSIVHTGGASGHVGIGGTSNLAGAAGVAAGAGAGNSTTQAPCGGPSYSNDCSKVPRFQCGPSVTCDGTTLKLQWHEHVMCPRSGSTSLWDTIFHYSCSYPCAKAACESIGSWPSSGSVIAQACQVGS